MGQLTRNSNIGRLTPFLLSEDVRRGGNKTRRQSRTQELAVPAPTPGTAIGRKIPEEDTGMKVTGKEGSVKEDDEFVFNSFCFLVKR